MPGASVSMTSDRGVAVLDCEGVLDAVATVELTVRSLGVTPLFTVPPANTVVAPFAALSVNEPEPIDV